MTDAWFQPLVNWIGAHPVAAGGLIFLLSFLESIIVIGLLVPALPLLFAIGVLIGLGHINGPYAVACAALGAFIGDGLSYWVGARWGSTLRSHWPFSRYPQLIDRGELLFRRHGSKSIVIARFVGAVRPFVPAVAGMLHMPLKHYLPASLFAAISWATVFLAPGWIFGASYDAVAAVADRLAVVLLALAALLTLVWFAVLYTYHWFAGHADRLLARALLWTREHPHLSRFTAPLIHPHRPESAALATLAVCLTGIAWGWFALLASVVAHGGPLALDLRVHAAMSSLRNPLADHLLAALATLGDWQVMGPPMLLTLGWLVWRRRFAAALHWVGAVGFGFVFTAFLGMAVDMPRPPTAHSGFGFPSIPVTMLTICLGFFAVLIARELPGRRRVWPYMLAGALVALLGFARLYFGAHWLTDIIGGVLFGVVWLLVIGLAYRRHFSRSFWMRPVALIFYLGFTVATLWHAPRTIDHVLAQFAPAPPTRMLDAERWWIRDWATLPVTRDTRGEHAAAHLDLQYAGDLDTLSQSFRAQGWVPQRQAGWLDVMGLLDRKRAGRDQPILPATYGPQAESLLLRRPGPQPDTVHALRLWRAPVLLDDGQTLWLASAQTLRYSRPLPWFGVWLPVDDDGAARHRVRQDARRDFELAESPSQDGLPVLRLRLPR